MRKLPRRTFLKRKKAPKSRSKAPSWSKLMKIADSLMSSYVRQFYAKDGRVKCFTCDHWGEIKKMQNGHWIVRQYKQTRWDLDNTRPQCYACNFLFNGRPHIFRANLVNEIGETRVLQLEDRAKEPFKANIEIAQLHIERFKALMHTLPVSE